jgi:hypothetical protein
MMPTPKTTAPAGTTSGEVSTAHNYLLLIVLMLSAVFTLFVVFGFSGRDHFWSIPLNGDPDWYQSTSNLMVPQMQDREILFHGIGRSIENAQHADIIILGNSVLKYGLNHELMAQFQRRNGIRIFNMNIPGLASGEFLRRIIHRWDLRPKIWLINALDYPADFFLPVIVDRFTRGPASADKIAIESWFSGYLRVLSRNVRWNVMALGVKYMPESIAGAIFPGLGYGDSWRSALDGNQYLELSTEHMGQHATIKVIRDQDCHAGEDQIRLARDYISDIGGTVILMQIPYERWCPGRVREIAEALGLETIIPPTAEYTVMDGTHLDHAGAVAFTNYFLDSLSKTSAFRNLTTLRRARSAQK